jgi:PAS domain S-box-containing protein
MDINNSQQYSADIINFLPDATFVIDNDGRVIAWNYAIESMTGVKAEEILGKGDHEYSLAFYGCRRPMLIDLALRRTAEGVERAYNAFKREGDAIVAETYIPSFKPGGIYLWAKASSLYNTEGNLVGAIESIRDITENKKADEELASEKGRLEIVTQNIGAGLAMISRDYHTLWANKVLQDLFGECVGKVCYTHYNKQEEICPGCGVREIFDHGVEKAVHEQLGLDSAGSTIWSQIIATPIRDKEGNITAVLELVVPITERKLAEIEVSKAKDAAEAAADAKAAFLANMSHELRTPMNAVIGFSSLLLDDNITQEQKEYIECIRDGGENLLAIINEILEFSRAEKEKVKLEHQPFSLKRCIDESLELVATQASKKGLNLSKNLINGTPYSIVGDHGRLRQILVNLLSNAVKFTNQGDVSVSVSSKATEGNRRQLFFEVKDTGIGISQDKMNELFEPFTQIERTISLKREGVGLGLAISKKLVELMGGKIWVESNPGQGTTFRFTIQTEVIHNGKPDLGKAERITSFKSLVGQKTLRILVAEDNPSNQKVLIEMLRRLGYRADAVADGRETIQALERQDYDLILMDIKMPEMDGISVTKIIRQQWPNKSPKIIAITAFALEGDREKCLEAGMDDYLAKPVKMNELESILIKYSAL